MIHVLGWYDNSNIGDEAYKLAFPKVLKNENLVFGEHIQGQPEAIIVGGGDVLCEAFLKKLEPYPHAKKYAFSVNLRPNQIGPHLDQFEKIICRNYTNSTDPRIQFCPDFTFSLEGSRENGTQLIKDIFQSHKSDLYKDVVAITLNGFLCKREKMLARDYVNFDKICFDLAKIMDNTPASFILIPFGNGFPENDKIANSCLYANSKFWKKNVLLFDKLSVQQTLDIFTAVDAAISTRLHSAIFSCIGETPFIDLSHHNKTELFMEFIDKKDWCLNFWHFNYKKAMSLIKDFLENKETYRNQVKVIKTNAKKLLSQINETKL